MRKEVIGNITLYCGDSLELLRAGVFGKIGAIVSDPPYGIGFQHSGGGVGANVPSRAAPSCVAPIAGDAAPFDPAPWIEAAPRPVDQPAGADYRLICLWGAEHYMQRLPQGGTLLAWDKHLGRGPDDSFTDCEWAWLGRKARREVFRWLWKGVAAQRIEHDMPPASVKGGKGRGAARFARMHVSQKPVELMRWCIGKVRPIAGLPILDPYMGSGSTLVAAYTLGLPAIGCEIDPVIFGQACERLAALGTSAAQAVS